MSKPPSPEPWLRGALPGVHPVVAPVLHALQQAREDLAYHTVDLSGSQIWAKPHGLTSLGFHLRHIAGSLDRLTTYLEGGTLTGDQLAALQREQEPGASQEELLDAVERALQRTETVLCSLDPATFADARFVGRLRLPTTVVGLSIHLAEHTQRHVGQAIAAAKLARASHP